MSSDLELCECGHTAEECVKLRCECCTEVKDGQVVHIHKDGHSHKTGGH